MKNLITYTVNKNFNNELYLSVQNGEVVIIKDGKLLESQEKIEKFNTNPNIVYWAGNRTMPSRLFSPNLYFKKGNKYVKHGFDPLREKPFSIPEGIDLAEFIINTSKKAMSYQNCDQNIGGPIDILIIKPYEAYWYRRK